MSGPGDNNQNKSISEFHQLVRNFGPTANRPTQNLVLYQPYLDTDLGSWIYWNGAAWTAAGSGTTADASDTVKGITKLSVAPASPTNPIALGANDAAVTNSRTPTGSAGGALASTYPNPTLAAVVTGATVNNPTQIIFNNGGQVTGATGGSAPVTSVTGTPPVASSGGATPAISVAITTTNDGGAVVKQAATPGTQQASANINVDGTIIAGTALKGASSTFPTIGTTTLAEKMGHVYLAGAKDVYPSNDNFGLFDRLVNYGFAPAEHWPQGADQLTWVGYAAYTGFTTPGVPDYANSQFRMGHNVAGSLKAFRYRAAATGANIFLRARVGITYVVSAGLMVDDGVNNADGNGANNFYRVYMTQAALAGAVTAVEQYRSGGGAVTTNVGPTLPLRPLRRIAVVRQWHALDQLGRWAWHHRRIRRDLVHRRLDRSNLDPGQGGAVRSLFNR
jgi:hypothetical protein